MVDMHSVNLDQMQDTDQLKTQLKAWLKAGETVELREQEHVLGRIVPEEPAVEPVAKRAVEWPDFEARARAIFGDRVLEENAVLMSREDSRY
jgi:hypothetical protein